MKKKNSSGNRQLNDHHAYYFSAYHLNKYQLTVPTLHLFGDSHEISDIRCLLR